MSVRKWWDEFPYKRRGRKPVPAGDAGQAGQGTITLFNDTYSAILLELEALRAQVVAMQAVVDAARAWRNAIVESGDPDDPDYEDERILDAGHQIYKTLTALDKAQAAQPEGEQAR